MASVASPDDAAAVEGTLVLPRALPPGPPPAPALVPPLLPPRPLPASPSSPPAAAPPANRGLPAYAFKRESISSSEVGPENRSPAPAPAPAPAPDLGTGPTVGAGGGTAYALASSSSSEASASMPNDGADDGALLCQGPTVAHGETPTQRTHYMQKKDTHPRPVPPNILSHVADCKRATNTGREATDTPSSDPHQSKTVSLHPLRSRCCLVTRCCFELHARRRQQARAQR
jgi:hypothetical protein